MKARSAGLRSKAFAVGKFAVTFDQFAAFVQETGHDAGSECYTGEADKWEKRSGRSWRNPGFARSGSHPAVCINWDDARAYVQWLSRKTGKTYRLLSEAEREYVARAGTTTPFWWGSTISTSQANYDGNYTYGNGSKGEFRKRTMPVDSFSPNPWGLYQVHGNVWEWAEDCYKNSYGGAPTDGSASTPGDCSRRVLRGGSWLSGPGFLRSAIRVRRTSDDRYVDIGFRVARTLVTP
jgi:formylglycine-generating enzyme required for sulfatase activity